MSRIDVSSDIAREAVRSEIARQIQQPAAGKNAPGVKQPTATGARGTQAAQTPQAAQGLAVPTDGVDRGAVVAVGPQVMSQADSRMPVNAPGSSPFAMLAQAGVMDLPPRLLATPAPMDRDASPSAKLQGNLGKLDGAAGKLAAQQPQLATRVLTATGKVREGMMLALSDSVRVYTKAESKVPRDTVSHVTEAINTEKSEAKMIAAAQSAMFAAKAAFPLGMDINAFVQAVLRESYLLQNEILKDYADKVKFFNEMKKKIRGQLARARELSKALQDGEPLPDDFDFLTFAGGSWTRYESAGDMDAATPDSDTSEGGPGTVMASVSLTPELRELFQVWLRPEPNLLISNLLADLAAQDTWKKKGSRMADYCDGAQLADIRAGVVTLSDDQLVTLVQACGQACNGGTHKGSASLLLEAIFTGATYGQLKMLREKMSPTIWTEIRNATSSVSRLEHLDVACESIDASLRDDPALTEVLELYAQLTDGSEGDRARLNANERLLWSMRSLDAETAKKFLEGIHTDGASPTLIGNLLFACDPSRVFADASPADWAFLGDVGGRAAEFYFAWTACGDTPGDSEPSLAPNRRASRVPSADRTIAQTDVQFSPEAVPALLRQQAAAASGADNSPRPSQVQSTAAGLGAEVPDLGSDPAESPATDELAGTPSEGPRHAFNAEEMKDYITRLEEDLSTMGDDSQLANADLQNALQVQQQMLQMMSNISKMLHDTAMSIIRKIGS